MPAHSEINMSNPSNKPHFQGLRTVIYAVSDLGTARTWYSSVLGFAPYFDQPFYVGFNVGGYELGLDPDPSTPRATGGGAVAYWGVSDAGSALERLLSLGAAPRTDLQEVGEGVKVATVCDPFGNIFGIIENPHFKLPSE
jgi:predicted enzyme related to lactoylglutathione lyase